MEQIISLISSPDLFQFFIKVVVVLVILTVTVIGKRYVDKKIDLIENQGSINKEVLDSLRQQKEEISNIVKDYRDIQKNMASIEILKNSVDGLTNELRELVKTVRDDYISKEICSIYRSGGYCSFMNKDKNIMNPTNAKN